MASRLVRTAIAFGVLVSACAVKLSDPTEPLPNGGVTGPAADCSKLQIVPKGAPGTGAAEPKLVGRFDLTDPKNPVFDWPGSYISARFQGTDVTVTLETLTRGTQKGPPADVAGQPFPLRPVVFVSVIDDGDPTFFTVEPNKTSYPVARGLDASRPHEIRIHRESEAVQGPIRFGGIQIGGGSLLPPTERQRRIEYIGDSITCGYGDRGANATCPFDIPDPSANGERVPVSESNYLAYGSLAARQLDADAVTICFSGKGVYLNYTEAGGAQESSAKEQAFDGNDPVLLDGKTTITLPSSDNQRPAYYLRTLGGEVTAPLWDFSKDPDTQVVVINIGTNDFARDLNQDSVPDGTIDRPTFQKDYETFVRDVVRKNRPNAHIFLALPPMVTDSFPLDNTRTDLRNILNAIVNDMNAKGDTKVYFIELVQMGTRYGLGCDYHPNLEVHRIMADQVAGAIRTKTCW